MLPFHLEGSTRNLEHRGVAPLLRQFRRVDGRRQDDNLLEREGTFLELLPRPRLQRGLVGVPLVQLIDHQHIVLVVTRQLSHHCESIGREQYLGLRTVASVLPGAVADNRSELATYLLGDELGGADHSLDQGFRHKDGHPLLEEPPRDLGRLTRPRLCLHDNVRGVGRHDGVTVGFDRQGGGDVLGHYVSIS